MSEIKAGTIVRAKERMYATGLTDRITEKDLFIVQGIDEGIILLNTPDPVWESQWFIVVENPTPLERLLAK